MNKQKDIETMYDLETKRIKNSYSKPTTSNALGAFYNELPFKIRIRFCFICAQCTSFWMMQGIKKMEPERRMLEYEMERAGKMILYS